MKGKIYILLVSVLLVLYQVTAAKSQGTQEVAPGADDTVAITEEVDQVDQEAKNEDGKKMVEQRLQDQFNVDETRIQGLRDQKLGYGEVGIVLSLAKQMPGGINDDNIQKIMELRQGETKRGWGNIARTLNLNLGQTHQQLQKIHTTGEISKKTETQEPATAKQQLDDVAQKSTNSGIAEKPANKSANSLFSESGRNPGPEKVERPNDSFRPEHTDKIGRK